MPRPKKLNIDKRYSQPSPNFGSNTDLRVCLKNLMYGRPAGAQHFLQDCIAELDKPESASLPNTPNEVQR